MLLVAFLVACTGDKSVALGQGPERDGRLVADVYTWRCSSSDTGDTAEEEWEGVFSYNVFFEYAPDALVARDLPAGSCVSGLDLFPIDAGAGGTSLPDGDVPEWSNTGLEGALTEESTGFYYDSVFANQRTCTRAEELLGDGTLLSKAGSFSGAQTPQPGVLNSVTLDGEVDDQSGLAFGAQVTASWDGSGWDESWIQVRREQGGSLVEAVTCNTSGLSSFTIDDSVWGAMSGALEVDVTNLYVAVQNTGVAQTADGQEVELLTRAMHVAVVAE